jgi:hypothetical protein
MAPTSKINQPPSERQPVKFVDLADAIGELLERRAVVVSHPDIRRPAMKVDHLMAERREQAFVAADKLGRDRDVMNAVDELVMRVPIRLLDDRELDVLEGGRFHLSNGGNSQR